MSKKHLVLDCEIIGKERPVFLTCAEVVETGKRFAFWHDKRGHTRKLEKLLSGDEYTVVTFNGEHFDRPLIAMAVMGHDERNIKVVATNIIEQKMVSWQTYREYDIDFLEYDHIDIKEVPPGVMLSLKIYEGRMHSPTIQDLPFHHDEEIFDSKAKRKLVEQYCFNDITETKRLFLTVKGDIDLRVTLGATYGVDLRSKSDAQCAEAILKKVCGIANGDKTVPRYVTYKAPSFIRTDSELINGLIEQCEQHLFKINPGNGSPEFPEFLTEPIQLAGGVYQMGIGGLHSQHDQNLYLESSDKELHSDIDVASYYPNIMMKAGLIPRLGGNKGELFLQAYEDIYHQRIDAKRSGDKPTANTLKIVLNGTFGKLGSIFCSFYAPELMLAVTITGQLNLLCLIHELSKLSKVFVQSANTDGILVSYPPKQRKRVLQVIMGNASRTGFEYEETPYQRIAMKDVNNYIAVTELRPAAIIDSRSITESTSDKVKVKRKGLYAEAGVHENKNPTMQVCSDAVAAFLKDGTPVEDFITQASDIRDFVAIRSVSGGGVQHTHEVEVDDWVLVKDVGSAKNEWMRQRWLDEGSDKTSVKRKSRPAPVLEGRGGVPFGRVARWYMTTQQLPAITYVGSGNKVPLTEGGKLALTLPKTIPADLDRQWYIDYANSMLNDLGVKNAATD